MHVFFEACPRLSFPIIVQCRLLSLWLQFMFPTRASHEVGFTLSGDKSAVLDPEAPDVDRHPLFQKATQYISILEPGDIVFIPG